MVGGKVEKVGKVRRVEEVAREDAGLGDYRWQYARLLRRGLLAMTWWSWYAELA